MAILFSHRWCVVLWFLLAVCHCGAASIDNDDVPYLSQFSSDVSPQNQESTPFHGDQFQSLRVTWIRQTQGQDNRTVTVGYDTVDGDDPQVVWLLNNRLIHETDSRFPQETVEERVASLRIPHTMDVWSVQLLLILDTIETLTDINLRPMEEGQTILEHGTDVSMALSSQEDVIFERQDEEQVLFIARFYAEDLPSANYTGIDVSYYRMLSADYDITMDIVTPGSQDDVIAVWRPELAEVPPALQERFDSVLRDHVMVRIMADEQNVRGLVQFTAAYKHSTCCRLFCGQKITRRAFVRSTQDRGGYWGRNWRLVFLPFQRSVNVSCGSNVDVSVTVFGEISPDIDLIKDYRLIRTGTEVSIFVFHRLLQTEAVFRFENVRPEMTGTYVVRAEDMTVGITHSITFTLSLENGC